MVLLGFAETSAFAEAPAANFLRFAEMLAGIFCGSWGCRALGQCEVWVTPEPAENEDVQRDESSQSHAHLRGET